MRILIRGAGDLATGIASRLYHSGHQLLMTEKETPLTVRRMAAFSRAVYEKTAPVEDMAGVLAHTIEEAEIVQKQGDIPILVDERAEASINYKPDVLVDAILAKRNLGTRITDAPLVIGVGPGFTAGEDCHCVVETKRGHTLGSVLYKGSAIPNTGVPGNVGGYTTERLIRAAEDGKMEPLVAIGDRVEIGQAVARTGGAEVYAQMSGVVRGMLQQGARVSKNLKIGDIDVRSERSHCFTISDKARAVGGGVLEAVSRFGYMRGKYAILVLAAGGSVRFGENKLCAVVSGKKLYGHTLNRMCAFQAYPVFFVTGYDEIIQAAQERGFYTVVNREPWKGISYSIRKGIEACLKCYPQIEGILFSVCDQPNVHISTIQQILNEAALHRGHIICAAHEGEMGNPVLWDKEFFPDLMGLTGDKGGKEIITRFRDRCRLVETQPEELKDIDLRTDIIE